MKCLPAVLLLIGLELLSRASFAYIPPSWFILSRTAENHGKGSYQWDVKVQFPTSSPEGAWANERWIIDEDDHYRVEVTGGGAFKDRLRMTLGYDPSRKTVIDGNGNKKIEKLPPFFSEPYFTFRRSQAIKTRLVSSRLAPALLLKSEPQKFSEKTVRAPDEAFLKLDRVSGVVSYGIVNPPTNPTAGIWIEQDQFRVLQVRFPDGAEVQAFGFEKSAREFFYPKSREARWKGQRVKMTTTGLVALPLKSTAPPPTSLPLLLPENEIVRDFYSLFR
jgi:hypothetical protein